MGVSGCGGNLDTAGASLPDHNVGEWESGRNGTQSDGQAGRSKPNLTEYAVSQKLVQNIFNKNK